MLSWANRQFFCMFLLLSPPGSSPTPQPITSGETTTDHQGIVFNKVKTVILADKYEHVKFLLPYPTMPAVFQIDIQNITTTLAEYWNASPGDCEDLQDRVVPDTHTEQLLQLTAKAHTEAQAELENLKTNLQAMLLPPTSHSRPKRFAGILAAAAAGAGLLAIGTHLTGGCIGGILGPCENEKNIADNRDTINQAIAQLHKQQLQWSELTEAVQDKFFIVAGELKDIRQTQQELAIQQQEIWNATATTLKGLTSAFKTMTICTEYLFMRSQINQLRNILSSRLQLMHTAIQNYRVALWGYRTTLLDAIPGLAHGLLPMSLISRDTLIAILERLHSQQAHTEDHLTLALPLDHLLRYYETPLVQRVQSHEEGLLITLAIPLTTRATILEVYEAIPLPMPNPDNETATVWQPESQYFAVTIQTRRENALLNQQQLEGCIGPQDAAICKTGFATTQSRKSCMATLFFHDTHQATDICETETTTLPKIETATNLGYGRWLITRRRGDAKDFKFNLMSTTAHQPTYPHNQVPGCTSCIITLACGTELQSEYLFLKADHTSCNSTGARRLDLQISPSLIALFNHLPSLKIPPTPQLPDDRARLLDRVPAEVPHLSLAIPRPPTSAADDLNKPLPFPRQIPNAQIPTLPPLTPSRSHAITIVTAILTTLAIHLLIALLRYSRAHCRKYLKPQAKPDGASPSETDAHKIPTQDTTATNRPQAYPTAPQVSLDTTMPLTQAQADRLAFLCSTPMRPSANAFHLRALPPPAYTRPSHQ